MGRAARAPARAVGEATAAKAWADEYRDRYTAPRTKLNDTAGGDRSSSLEHREPRVRWRGLRWAKRIALSIVGFTVLAIGIVMIVLPGPAILVIPIGLGILGLEFAWARRWLRKVKESTTSIVDSVRRKKQ